MSSLYKCVSCSEPIQPTKPRLSCNSCAPIATLCANCYVVQDYPPQHQEESHSILLHRHSGYLPAPPPPPPRTQPARNSYASGTTRRRPVSAAYSEAPPRKPPRPTIPETRNVPEYGPPVASQPPTPLSPAPPEQQYQPPSQSTEWNGPSQPPPLQNTEHQYQQQQQPQPASWAPPSQPPPQSTEQQHYQTPPQYSNWSPPPQGPPPPGPPPQSSKPQYQQQQQEQQQQQQQQQQEQPQSAGWTPFFNQDMTPSSSFRRLIEDLFHHLDPQRTGFISPEVYSDYLDACGAPANHNIWKAARARSPQYGHDLADRELADHFTSYSVNFALRPRTPPTTPVDSPLNPMSYLPPAQRAHLSRFIPPQTAANSLSGGQKPMLSLRGWTDLTICSVLLNPSAAWGQLDRVMREYRVPAWTEWGDLPREMLPLAPYQPEVERVRVMLEGARINAEREVDAVHARLKIEKQGRQHALDLLDDRRWVYQ